MIRTTICVMSCARESGNPFYLPMIADNFAIRTNRTDVNVNFRHVCRGLCPHWESWVNTGSARPPADDGTLVAERLH